MAMMLLVIWKPGLWQVTHLQRMQPVFLFLLIVKVEYPAINDSLQ